MNAHSESHAGGVRSVRHKPGKNLYILYRRDDRSMLCLSLDERAAGPVDSRRIPALVQHLEDHARGEPRADECPGISLHTLPDDPGLPALDAAWNPVPGDDLCRTLETALECRDSRPGAVVGITAIPRHYKPGSRCVIEYGVELQRGGATAPRPQTVYGKLFAKVEQARALDAAMRVVQAACDAESLPPLSPTPLGVCEPLGMCITGAAADACESRSGMSVLRPDIAAAASRRPATPSDALCAAAAALARLHSSSIALAGLETRSAAYEADRAVERGELIASYYPGMAGDVRDVARQTAGALIEQSAAAVVRPCHGSYKRSQLVYTVAGALTVVDWDSMCAADPALDLGCFLAHLRPAAVWYSRRGARAWFAAAAACWTQAYAHEMTSRGVSPDVVTAIVGRSAAYEAATLLKMATRRLRRLQSPRHGELLAILDEAGCCLSSDAAA